MKILSTVHGVSSDPARDSEDAFRVQERDECVLAVLADGLGASKEGGAAARRAVEMFHDYYFTRPKAWSARRALREFTNQINRLFYQESAQRHGSPELLCTLSVAAIDGDHLYGLSVGDSPVYLWRRGVVKQLTEPHSLAADGLDHVLTRAVGLESQIDPHCFETTVERGDVVLLCSDGVSTVLPTDRLADLIARDAGARAIVSTAREATEENPAMRDDASAIVLHIQEPGWRDHEGRTPLVVAPKLKSGDAIDGYRLDHSLQDDDRVWRATAVDGSRHVLKFPPLEAAHDEARRDAFVREMWNATRVHSPDFVRVSPPKNLSWGYYAMEFVEAPTLREVLKTDTLPIEEAIILGRTVLRAGQFLLTRNLAHGDLKPDNLLVVRSADKVGFLLLDLGSAAELFSVTSRAGTPSYLAPERFRGDPLSERTELFAIGVTVYEALTGTYPYGEVERFQTPRFDSNPKRLSRLNPAVPPWLESVALRAVAADPAHRYQNFSEMAYDLDHPQKVAPYHRKDAALLERNPLRFYKGLCLVLFLVCLALIAQLTTR
ncbi:MAG: protein phosphatase 2C domain-containing protein [Opitutus sp.]